MSDGSPSIGQATGRDRLGNYMRIVEPVMLVLAVASVPLFLLEHRHWLIAAAGWLVVAAFVADLVVRVVLVDGSRRGYLIRHWYDVVIVVLSVLPQLRALRGLRALQLLRMARVLVAAHKAAVALAGGWRGMRGKALIISSSALAVLAMLAVYESERAGGGDIDSVGQTLWWAATTVTTVGYGDLAPVTGSARAAAVVLMVSGVSLFGLLTANLSARFFQKDALLTYEQMAELLGGRAPCPNCGHTQPGHSSGAADPGAPAPDDDVVSAR